jgi:hypothetical protein
MTKKIDPTYPSSPMDAMDDEERARYKAEQHASLTDEEQAEIRRMKAMYPPSSFNDDQDEPTPPSPSPPRP